MTDTEKLQILDKVKNRLLTLGELTVSLDKYHLSIDPKLWHSIFKTVECNDWGITKKVNGEDIDTNNCINHNKST